MPCLAADEAVKTLADHFSQPLPAKDGEALVDSERLKSEWVLFTGLYRKKCADLQADFVVQELAKQEESRKNKDKTQYKAKKQLPMTESLAWLLTDETALHTFPNITILAHGALVVPVDSADCERGFSAMKHIKNALRNRLSQASLEQLLTIAINGPELSDSVAVDEILVEALGFWYAGVSGKTDQVVVRRANLVGVKKQFEDKDFVWGQSYGASEAGLAASKAQREANEQQRLEGVERTRAAKDAQLKAKAEKEAKAEAKKAEKIKKKAAKKAKKAAEKEVAVEPSAADRDGAVVAAIIDKSVRQVDKDEVAHLAAQDDASIREAEQKNQALPQPQVRPLILN